MVNRKTTTYFTTRLGVRTSLSQPDFVDTFLEF